MDARRVLTRIHMLPRNKTVLLRQAAVALTLTMLFCLVADAQVFGKWYCGLEEVEVQVFEVVEKGRARTETPLPHVRVQVYHFDDTIKWRSYKTGDDGTVTARVRSCVDVRGSISTLASAKKHVDAKVCHIPGFRSVVEAFPFRLITIEEDHIVIKLYVELTPFPPYSGRNTYFDDFSNPSSGWPTGPENRYVDGGYEMTSRASSSGTWWGGMVLAPQTFAADFVVEVEASAQSDLAGYGILWQSADPGADKLFYFSLSGDGDYSLADASGLSAPPYTWLVLLMGDSPAIRQYPATNTLRLVCQGNNVAFFVNDVQLANRQIPSLGAANIGLVVHSSGDSGWVRFDDFAVEEKRAQDDEWESFVSYDGDCLQRPSGTTCVRYDDGFTWLVRDSILGWSQEGAVQIAHGIQADYHHWLGTNLVKRVEK